MASAEIDLVPRETTEEIVRRDWASTDRSVNHDLEACHTRGSRGFSVPHAIPIRTDRTWACPLWLRVQQRFSPRELTSREEEGGEDRNSRCFSRTTIRLKICYEFLFRPRLQTRIDSTPDCLWNAAADSPSPTISTSSICCGAAGTVPDHTASAWRAAISSGQKTRTSRQ